MITPHPAVQHNTKASYIHIKYRATAKAKDKRTANRRYRHTLSMLERAFTHDPEMFDAEDFAAPTFSNWDID